MPRIMRKKIYLGVWMTQINQNKHPFIYLIMGKKKQNKPTKQGYLNNQPMLFIGHNILANLTHFSPNPNPALCLARVSTTVRFIFFGACRGTSQLTTPSAIGTSTNVLTLNENDKKKMVFMIKLIKNQEIIIPYLSVMHN